MIFINSEIIEIGRELSKHSGKLEFFSIYTYLIVTCSFGNRL